ncbi:LemA family protein [Roseateles sp. BYS180W]|uniref:LemA family protein n=1 Tax=Roseateles rivi TaxID=3299028 RepID=A0ABW7FT90_9BURK
MNWTNLLGWLALALILFWAIGAYHRMVQLRSAIGAAYRQLDEALNQRSTLCEQLVAQLGPLLDNEQATFDALASAQAEAQTAAQAVRARPHAGDPVARLAVASAMHAAALTRLMSLVEHHPEIAYRAEIAPLMDELKMVERQRSFARQVFNQAVTTYNEAVQEFPTRVLNSIFGFSEARSL